MKGKKWESWVDAILIEKYANTLNAELVKETGYGERTIVRHARKLGLFKSKEFMSMTQRHAAEEGIRWYEYMRITGQKFNRKIVQHNGTFKKGRVPDKEIEKKRIQAIRDRAWDDRKRIMHGMKPRAKWKYNTSAYEELKSKINNDNKSKI